MNRIERLQSILIQLQSKKVVKAREIANRFQISLRTVYRDIRTLEESGVPIGAEAGIGYFLNESFTLPPVLFNTREAMALLLAGKLIPHFTDLQTTQSLQNALYKIKSVVKLHDKEAIEIIENQMHIYNGISPSPARNSLFLYEIQTALINNQVIQIKYYSPTNLSETLRDIEPVALLFYAMNWHLIAFCLLRGDYRDFRLDRILELKQSGTYFNRNLKQSLNEFIQKQKNENKYFEIEVLVSESVAILLSDSKYWYGFISEEKVNDKIKMAFINPDLTGFARWLTTLGSGVEILYPAELKTQVFSMVESLAHFYLKK